MQGLASSTQPLPSPASPDSVHYRVPERARRKSHWEFHTSSSALGTCSLDPSRQACVAHCRDPPLTCLSCALIPSRTLPIVANTERAFFPGRAIHHSFSQPPPAQESHLLSTGRRERQQVFLKSLYPLGDRKENIPSERLVTHIKGDKSLHLHLHGPGIRCGPVPPSSACRGRTTSTFQALTETERKCSQANNTSPCQGIFHF